MPSLRICLLAASFSALLLAQNKPQPPKASGETAVEPKAPAHPEPVEAAPSARATHAESIRGLEMSAMDQSADPCVNFYQYACGTWLKNNPIPSDRSRWGRFDELEERNLEILRGILEKASVNDPKRDATDQKIGDYYAACMDEQAVESKGIAPLEPELNRIAAISDLAALTDEVARLHSLGVNVLFSFSSGQDAKDSTQVIAQADQGGMGLPDRDYYLRDDPKSEELRKQYVSHVGNMLKLVGDSPDRAAAEADTVMKIETALAKGALDNVSRRDPVKTYHKMSPADLKSLDPAFEWTKYFTDTAAPPIHGINVSEPDFFRHVQELLKTTSLDDWKTYLRWHTVNAAAPLLPAAFVNENFDFNGRILTGAKELRPRWKRCVSMVDDELGEALGRKYVDQTFGAEGKRRTLAMVRLIEKAMADDIEHLAWMTPATKKEALLKLHAIANKIGYPDQWRDYSSVDILRGDALGNSGRATVFEFHRQLAKIGKPVDRGEWGMSPPTVNAYYNAQMNNINFPAGILQPPFYSNQGDDAVNLGGIGAVIGHELTHGFDDEGRQFDPKGNLRDWWTAADAKEFEQRAECIVNEYSGFTATDDVHLNGKLTLGENTADNGGLRLAYMALMASLGGHVVPKTGDLTPEQRLFLGWGQIWCANETDEVLRLLAATNPHSPGRFRVNGVVSNMPEFQQAFACKAGQPMVRKDACHVW